KLGRLVSQGGTLVDILVGLFVDDMAATADLELLESGRLSSQQLKSCLRDLQHLPAMTPMSYPIEEFERLVFVEVLVFVQRGGLEALKELDPDFERQPEGPARPGVGRPISDVDWNVA